MRLIVHYVWLGVALFLVALIMSWLVYPVALRAARVWGFYDNPDYRKLQRKPVPVLGGLPVFLGMAIAVLIMMTISFSWKPVLMLTAMFVLMLVGMVDDRNGLSPYLRFAIEIFVVGGLVFVNGSAIDNLHGLWGVYELPGFISVPLSIITGVGIINAINLIDGVDGYSSGYIMFASLLFALLFFVAKVSGMAIISFIAAGAIFPFFLHNVFGKKTKMFIGDGGTLMLGTLMTSFVFSILKRNSALWLFEQETGLSIPAVALAVLAIPIFDTLRVMFWRLAKGQSPFYPDKTHLHHLYIGFGFSHFGTTLMILFQAMLIVLTLILSWKLGANADVQLYAVIGASLFWTTVIYYIAKKSELSKGRFAGLLSRIGAVSHFEKYAAWGWMRKFVDGELFIAGQYEELEGSDNL